MTTYHKRSTQDVVSEKWTIDLPQGAMFASVSQVFNTSGSPVSWTYQQTVMSGQLILDFGLDQVAGIVAYSYELEGSSEEPVVAHGGVVNVHVHQYNGAESSKQ